MLFRLVKRRVKGENTTKKESWMMVRLLSVHPSSSPVVGRRRGAGLGPSSFGSFSLLVLFFLFACWGGHEAVSGVPPYPVNTGNHYSPYGGGVDTATTTGGGPASYGTHTEEPLYYETNQPPQPPPYGFNIPPAAAYPPPPQGAQQGYPAGGAPAAGKAEEPIRVQVEHVIAKDGKSLGPPIKGHGFFLLGLFAFIVCLIAIYSDPAAHDKRLGPALGMNFKSLFKFEDFARSSLVVLTILLSPVLLVYGIVRLAMTLPSWVKWAWHNDEVTLATVGMWILYIWLALISPHGKTKTVPMGSV